MWAHGDRLLIKVVLENLLGNSLKYSSERAEIRITFSSLLDEKGHRVFFVKDNGAGFPAESACRLFKPLVRLHSQDRFAGTGLGLASVARIIDLHHGCIWAEGAEDNGATFYFTLPAALSCMDGKPWASLPTPDVDHPNVI
jgi:signal transduction histidine kinase